MHRQLVLTEDTLRVILALLPSSPICGELLRACENAGGNASLAIGEVREIEQTLTAARTGAAMGSGVSALLRLHGDALYGALRRIDLEMLEAAGSTVTVVIVGADRDTTPAPAPGHGSEGR